MEKYVFVPTGGIVTSDSRLGGPLYRPAGESRPAGNGEKRAAAAKPGAKAPTRRRRTKKEG